MNTAGPAVHIVDRRAYPINVAADSSGLYFEDARGPDSLGFLVHSTPGGTLRSHRAPVNALLALAGGKLDQLAFHANGHQFIDAYDPTTLVRVSSARVSNKDRMFAGTGIGLLVLNEPSRSDRRVVERQQADEHREPEREPDGGERLHGADRAAGHRHHRCRRSHVAGPAGLVAFSGAFSMLM